MAIEETLSDEVIDSWMRVDDDVCGRRTCEGPYVATTMALRLADLLGVDGRGHPALFSSFALWTTILGRAAITMGEEAKAKEAAPKP